MLTQKQSYFLEVYLTEPVLSEACRKANISRQSYYKWLNDKEFRERLKEIQKGVIEGVKERLDKLTVKALDELDKLLSKSNDNVKVRCIGIVLDNLFKAKELELEERIEKLEERLDKK